MGERTKKVEAEERRGGEGTMFLSFGISVLFRTSLRPLRLSVSRSTARCCSSTVGRFTYKFNKHISYLMHALSRECFDRPGPPSSSTEYTSLSSSLSVSRSPTRFSAPYSLRIVGRRVSRVSRGFRLAGRRTIRGGRDPEEFLGPKRPTIGENRSAEHIESRETGELRAVARNRRWLRVLRAALAGCPPSGPHASPRLRNASSSRLESREIRAISAASTK